MFKKSKTDSKPNVNAFSNNKVKVEGKQNKMEVKPEKKQKKAKKENMQISEMADNNDDDLSSFTVNKTYADQFVERETAVAFSRSNSNRFGKKSSHFDSLKNLFDEEAEEAEQEAQRGSSDSDDESEDEHGDKLDVNLDAQINATLAAIRRNDPSIHDPNKKFIKERDESDDDDKPKQKKKSIKQIMGEQLIEQDGSESEEQEEEGWTNHKPKLTEVEEQKRNKKEFLAKVKQDAAEGSESDSDDVDTFFSKKQKSQEEKNKDLLEMEEFDKQSKQALEEYFTAKAGGAGKSKANLSKDDQFLREYISKQWWKATDGTDELPSFEEITGKEKFEHPDDSEDEEILDNQDSFEAAYNFRFEQEGGTQIVSYPRQIEDSVRQTTSKRKKARDNKAERIAADKAVKAEELKRLKNLKQQEIMGKLEQIKAICGSSGFSMKPQELTKDFDPQEYDRKMAEMFNDDYYAEDDNKDDDALYKEIMGEELEEMVRDIKPQKYRKQELEKEKKYTAKQLKRMKQNQKKNEQAAEYYDGDGGEEADPNAPNWALADGEDPLQAAERVKAELDQKIKDLYNLDYEDIIGGDIACRFKYQTVPKATFGLGIEDVLMTDDKELNQMVSIKKLAPYREDVRDEVWWNMKGNRGKPHARIAAHEAKKAKMAAAGADKTRTTVAETAEKPVAKSTQNDYPKKQTNQHKPKLQPQTDDSEGGAGTKPITKAAKRRARLNKNKNRPESAGNRQTPENSTEEGEDTHATKQEPEKKEKTEKKEITPEEGHKKSQKRKRGDDNKKLVGGSESNKPAGVKKEKVAGPGTDKKPVGAGDRTSSVEGEMSKAKKRKLRLQKLKATKAGSSTAEPLAEPAVQGWGQ